MIKIALLLLAGAIIGYCLRSFGQKTNNVNVRKTINDLNRQVETLRQTCARMNLEETQRLESFARRRQYFEENDISDVENQMRFISQGHLRPARPVNKEAVRVLYALDEWIHKYEPQWRLSFEVSMGAFIKTAFDLEDRFLKAAFSSYNSKRVDFLLIDRYGNPTLVIEYHGSGHDLSENASDRMEVKRLALERAGIPLLEIPAHANKIQILDMITVALAPRTGATFISIKTEMEKGT